MKSSPHSAQPIKLLHCLQGWPPAGPNHFRWEDGRLVYMLPDRSLDSRSWDKVVVPTPSQWHEFWRVCDEIDVWSWPPTLGNMSVIDGLQWILELEVGGRQVASRGQVVGAPADFDNKLMRLHRALQVMTGWHQPSESD